MHATWMKFYIGLSGILSGVMVPGRLVTELRRGRQSRGWLSALNIALDRWRPGTPVARLTTYTFIGY